MIEFYHRQTGKVIDNPMVLCELSVDNTGSVIHNRYKNSLVPEEGSNHREDLGWRVTHRYHEQMMLREIQSFMAETGLTPQDIMDRLQDMEKN
jgi:hypothetical protein